MVRFSFCSSSNFFAPNKVSIFLTKTNLVPILLLTPMSSFDPITSRCVSCTHFKLCSKTIHGALVCLHRLISCLHRESKSCDCVIEGPFYCKTCMVKADPGQEHVCPGLKFIVKSPATFPSPDETS